MTYQLLTGNYTEAMTVGFAAGTAPDVFITSWCSPDYGPIASWSQMGFLADLTPFVESDKEEINLSDMPAVFQKMAQVDGRWWAFPILVYAGAGVWYNRTMLQEAGLQDPSPDWTVEDFVEYARKLTEDTNGDQTPDKWGTEPAGSHFARMKSAWFYDETGARFVGKAEQFLRGLKFAHDIYQTYQVGPPIHYAVDLAVDLVVA